MKLIRHVWFVLVSYFICHVAVSAQWITTGGPFSYVSRLLVSDTTMCAGIDPSFGYISNLTMLYRSTDYGSNWIAANTGLPRYGIRTLGAFQGRLFVTADVDPYISKDGGATWSKINTVPSWIRSFVPFNNVLYAGVWMGGIYISTDAGDHWTKLAGISPNEPHLTCMTIYMDKTNVMQMLVGTAYEGIYRSTDGGATWSLANDGITNLAVQEFVLTDTYLFAATSGDVFRSSNNGAQWAWASKGLPTGGIHSIVAAGRRLIVGTAYGVYVSDNDGGSWTANNQGLSAEITQGLSQGVADLAISGPYLFAATWGMGVCKRPLSEITVPVEGNAVNLPRSFLLCQNYPNPFNPTTTIRFDLPSASYVSLGVFDLLGKRIATIVSSRLPAGQHSYIWDPKDLPSGTYFYRIEAGALIATKALTILR